MDNLIQTRATIHVISAGYALPALLAANAATLFALGQFGAIPSWIRTAAALFLAF